MLELIPLLFYGAILGSLLLIGDRVGEILATAITSKCRHTPLLRLPGWVSICVSLLIPSVILTGFLSELAHPYRHNALHHLSMDIETLVGLAFVCTGVMGGFMNKMRRK